MQSCILRYFSALEICCFRDAKKNSPGAIKDANIQNNLLSSKLVDGPVKSSFRQNSSNQKQDHRGSDYISLSGHRAGEAAVFCAHGANIEALMPKLGHSDYYTEPKIQELAAKERAEPGYCQRAKDFVVGRKGYDSIKFFGESDVRQLDLDSIIQFNECKISVYEKHESKIPPVGQGLNKPAEITLLNVKCVDKKTGQHCTEVVVVDEFERKLKRITEKKGAEFMSYNAIKEEFKFRVKHFIPTPGQGLSKSAEMTLLNVESVDQHCTKGVEVDKSKKRLKRKTEDFLGEEFMSDNAIEAECKSRVKHFIPTPGQGLSKPADMTLLNVKSVDQHCMKGVEVEKYEKRLKRKTEDLGEEFMSDNAIEAERKSRLKRCSQQGLDESGFWKMWRNLREFSMEYLKSNVCN
ncbi:nuclear pore complex protein NUP98B-like [Cryptomeria japonica]|uniref:nuclear pore complex protein NUP98B-like n=1 Tax=Cryptomeria japonica TaxID=3369 RepID=UPI0027D9E5ED|nr:nuclear pore complex protein NUP98B-like [Cryptomeria japonica]